MALYSREIILPKVFYCFVISAILLRVIFLNKSTNKEEFQENTNLPKIKTFSNYFQSSLRDNSFLVNNKKCKIPDLDFWRPEVMRFIKPAESFDCKIFQYFNLTYVENNLLEINEEILALNGYHLNEVSCCYQIIERITQNLTNFTEDADNQQRLSETCYKMKKTTKPKAASLLVSCRSNMGVLFYENFHLVAVFPEHNQLYLDSSFSSENLHLIKKLEFWKNYRIYQEANINKNFGGKLQSSNKKEFERISKTGRPPNILILGIDSTSRLHFHRFMNRTLKTMKNLINSIEMKGYSKVDDNTFPNVIPFLTGNSVDELRNKCNPNHSHPLDNCPFIWKHFSENNYLTALLEDMPDIGTFNHLKTGFVHSPTDIYIRPFMLASYHHRKKRHYAGCHLYQRSEEIILNYAIDLATLADTNEIPFFIFSWLTDLTHDNMNNIQLLDKQFSETIFKLHQRGLLQNTLLLIMGDHGYRFLEIRSTLTGWYEDKLPTMWINLPEPIVKMNPSWVNALKYNSNRLTTPFNMHSLFVDILKRYKLRLPRRELEKWKRLYNRSLSPFRRLPDRSCEEAGISPNYCACSTPIPYNSNETFVSLAANTVIQYINKVTPYQCKDLSVKMITGAATISFKENVSDTKEISNIYSDDDLPEQLIVAFITQPGNFRFEAYISYNKISEKFKLIPFPLRTNLINSGWHCLSKKDMNCAAMCFCKN